MTSLNVLLLMAAAAAFATCLLHISVGGRLAARPLLAADLRSLVKHTHYYCWHLVSAALVLMAGALAWGAIDPRAREAAALGAALAIAFMAVNVAQNSVQRLSFKRHPQGLFFLVISALAVAGLAHG